MSTGRGKLVGVTGGAAPRPVNGKRTGGRVLGINDEMRQMLRYELWREGMFEPAS